MMHASDDTVIPTAPPLGDRGAAGADPLGPATLGRRLLELRLQHRQERLQLVLSALRDRARTADGPGGAPVPEPLTAAIAGFQQELDAVQAELRGLEEGP